MRVFLLVLEFNYLEFFNLLNFYCDCYFDNILIMGLLLKKIWWCLGILFDEVILCISILLRICNEVLGRGEGEGWYFVRWEIGIGKGREKYRF